MTTATAAETSDSIYRRLVQGVTDYAIYMLDPDGIVTSWNAGAQNAKGYTAEEIIGQHFSHFYSSEDIEQGLPTSVLEQARIEGRFEGTGWRIRRDSSRFWAHVVIDRISDDDGHIIGYAKITRDLTDQKAQAHLAHHDALTGLPNRVVLQSRLERVLQQTHSDQVCALLFLDLDRFKSVNDSLGHAAGDELLKVVAHRIHAAVRRSDLLVRLGGDEFVVLQEGISGLTETTALAERLLSALRLPFVIKKSQVTIGVSIGICLATVGGDTSDLLLHKADLALYRAKTEGSNCYRYYDPQMDEYAQQRQELEQDLRNALKEDQFELHYQPVIELQQNTITGFEALLRWSRPNHGRVSPADFIPFAEKLGLMQEIGNWVLETACREAKGWPHAIPVSVNVSPAQLRDPNFVEGLQTILRDTGLSPSQLELEITETDIIHDIETAAAILDRLRAIGVRVALDDFGTGYSSLSFLQSLPFTRIKIDRSFIQGYGISPQATTIVQAITGLCHSLGIEVTAEGVETEEQAVLLKTERSVQAQGYWFSRPQPAAGIPAIIKRFR